MDYHRKNSRKGKMHRKTTQRRQHVVQVLLVNEAIPVLVNHVKGLFELLDLGLVKHGEHIGRSEGASWWSWSSLFCSTWWWFKSAHPRGYDQRLPYWSLTREI